MTIDSSELRQLFDFSVHLAREAGAITERYFKGTLSPARKADNSFVTVADREAERHLRKSIEQVFPDDAILGEEEAEKLGSSGRRWILDPIDGTYAFVHGVPFYGVMIGLEVDGETILGVVNLPALSEIIYAARGLGCFWNDKPARVSSTSALNQALLLATDFSTTREDRFGSAGRFAPESECIAHVGRLLWSRPRGHRPRRCDARSGYEYLGLRCATSDH